VLFGQDGVERAGQEVGLARDGRGGGGHRSPLSQPPRGIHVGG
jgi:hypothetical protein